MNKHTFFIILISIILLPFWDGNAQEKITHPKNEFRGVWIATVANIDWPKINTDSVTKQKADFIEILETYKKMNYNAVIVQIRSSGEAFYPTELAPWSRYLTGKEGKAPTPFYDPLEWMITEAHARGFEFHAWLNPYRATMDIKTENLSPKHDFNRHRNWMIKYGQSGKEKFYYDPGLPEVQSHLTKVVEEVVQNYDIDAIHFDDYFYPYREVGQTFNDKSSFAKYGNGLKLEEWRRANVDTLVKRVSHTIKDCKPWVQFGISPFGVWRNKSVDPKGSDTESGQTNYDDLYADPMTWMEYKWIDYLVPQLYWSMEHPKASYSKLLKWWAENSKNTAIYIGNGTYKINNDSDKRWNNPMEIPNQIDITRTYKNVQGNAFFSAKWFLNKHQNVTKIIMENQYKYPALPYAVPNLKQIVIDSPAISTFENTTTKSIFSFKYPLNSKVRYIMVYRAKRTSKIDINDPSQIIDKITLTQKCEDLITVTILTPKENEHSSYAFTYVDFYGNESTPTLVN
ncbi:glycoside hydrolase family 10 protein [Flavobacterium eburneipallidum]|uniref:glycoside hydrolase family 10 protein n=1 Tax=Flavobacterium eburneipallidum TaxID=3003263 RepID=UPI0022ABE93F|nr:family 10 glycosylhydrolase [Flavobacterium eburneipallidum]